LSRTDDVTFLLGVRNRAGYRLVNALASMRAQLYPADLIRIVVVDYGSDAETAREIERICVGHRAEYVPVRQVSTWSRGRCLNVGLRRVETKFVLVSDMDIVFSPTYVSAAVRVLATSPAALACSAMWDLPEESAEVLERAARSGQLQFASLKRLCVARHDWEWHGSICMTYTALFRAVGGYDEFYEGWGLEDDDLVRRFAYLGLRPTCVDRDSFYMHQWHPPSDRGGRERNLAYFDNAHSIVRNGGNRGAAS
jgi:predicted glycosyltransferase involved in capsule biosynthesis